jgi:hypothetical protein
MLYRKINQHRCAGHSTGDGGATGVESMQGDVSRRMTQPMRNPILSTPTEEADRHYTIGRHRPIGGIRIGRCPIRMRITWQYKGVRSSSRTQIVAGEIACGGIAFPYRVGRERTGQ